eukprot:scaffold871_cov130-Cylindrotheca_fusiformis.AAC.18
MVRAGAIARRVIDELEDEGCDTKKGGCDDTIKDLFRGRTLDDYYTEGNDYGLGYYSNNPSSTNRNCLQCTTGRGSGLSFQELRGFHLMTTTTTVAQEPNEGNHYAPSQSLLEGLVSEHMSGMAPLALNECGYPIDFSPLDFASEGGNMVLWDNEKGGEFPWDPRYYGAPITGDFDPEFIMQHATDSASTAGTMATGHKGGVNMMSQTMYEEDVSTLVEDAMFCGKAAGVVSSVPVFHATPGSFIVHTNNRRDGPALQRTFEKVNPTMASGTCASRYQPSEEQKERMRSGTMSSQWTLLEQSDDVKAEASHSFQHTIIDFYDKVKDLDPNKGDHLFVCLGGQYTASQEQNLPYRGVDSTYSNRWCSAGEAILDVDDNPTGIKATTNDTLCNHYSAEEIEHIPHITENVKAALDFLSKDDDGFFLMYEQGDIDWAAHANHMDDLLGTMLDIDDTVKEILSWIDNNGGWSKNALYVTADHDHYVTLLDEFPEKLANLLIDGISHLITPKNNSNVNTWDAAIAGGRHKDDSKSQTEHLNDFSTWSAEDIVNVGHFWGPRGSGGNGWGSHSTRPVPVFHQGDNDCIESFLGAGFQVLGRDVRGTPGKIDQMHLHACMMRNMFDL